MKLTKEEFIMRIKSDDRLTDDVKAEYLEDIDDSMELETSYEDNPDYIKKEDAEAEIAIWKQKYIDRFGVTEKEKEKEDKVIEDDEVIEETVDLYE